MHMKSYTYSKESNLRAAIAHGIINNSIQYHRNDFATSQPFVCPFVPSSNSADIHFALNPHEIDKRNTCLTLGPM